MKINEDDPDRERKANSITDGVNNVYADSITAAGDLVSTGLEVAGTVAESAGSIAGAVAEGAASVAGEAASGCAGCSWIILLAIGLIVSAGATLAAMG